MDCEYCGKDGHTVDNCEELKEDTAKNPMGLDDDELRRRKDLRENIANRIQWRREKYMQGLFVNSPNRRLEFPCHRCKYVEFWDDMYKLMLELKDGE